MIEPVFLPLQEGHCIQAPAPEHEPDLAASTQAVDGEKHLVPRQIGTLTHDLFEVACVCMMHNVGHLIFQGRLSRHTPPL